MKNFFAFALLLSTLSFAGFIGVSPVKNVVARDTSYHIPLAGGGSVVQLTVIGSASRGVYVTLGTVSSTAKNGHGGAGDTATTANNSFFVKSGTTVARARPANATYVALITSDSTKADTLQVEVGN